MKIELDHVVPAPLAAEDLGDSQIWDAEVVFEPGELVLVRAPSGRGKSTLLALIHGSRRDYSGQVRLDGEDVSGWSLDRWSEARRRELAVVFQGVRLFPDLTGLENIELKARLTGDPDPDAIRAMAATLGVADVLDRPSRFMSFGQRQRLAIIRALEQPARWLLMDEPFSHLDAANTAVACQLITEVCQRQGAGLVVTSLGEDAPIAWDRELRL